MNYILVDTKQNLIYTPYKLRYLLHIFHKWHQLESLKNIKYCPQAMIKIFNIKLNNIKVPNWEYNHTSILNECTLMFIIYL